MPKKFNYIMKKKPKYNDIPPGGEPIGELEIVEDNLPRPEDLILKEDITKVTIELSSHSINFFMQQAKKYKMSYQQFIRNIIEDYVKRHNSNKS